MTSRHRTCRRCGNPAEPGSDHCRDCGPDEGGSGLVLAIALNPRALAFARACVEAERTRGHLPAGLLQAALRGLEHLERELARRRQTAERN